MSWSPDGERLFYYVLTEDTRRDIFAFSFRDGQTTPIRATPADERSPVVSPDGRWLAYVSDASGRYEVYVASLSDPDLQRQASREGGVEPMWSPTGDELYYRSPNQKLMAAGFQAAPSPSIAIPVELFEDDYRRDEFLNPAYAVGPDGRFLMATRASQSDAGSSLRSVLGFAAELDRLVTARQ